MAPLQKWHLCKNGTFENEWARKNGKQTVEDKIKNCKIEN
jgi:hypothetical protein